MAAEHSDPMTSDTPGKNVLRKSGGSCLNFSVLMTTVFKAFGRFEDVEEIRECTLINLALGVEEITAF